MVNSKVQQIVIIMKKLYNTHTEKLHQKFKKQHPQSLVLTALHAYTNHFCHIALSSIQLQTIITRNRLSFQLYLVLVTEQLFSPLTISNNFPTTRVDCKCPTKLFCHVKD